MFLDAPDRAPGMLRLRDVPPTSKQAVRIRAQAAMRRTEKHRLAESMRALRPNGGTLGLTRNQARCLDFIRRYIGERGASPSYDEIRLAMGFANRSAVFRIVGQLVDRGFVNRAAGMARSITIAAPPRSCCPNCGHDLSGAAQ